MAKKTLKDFDEGVDGYARPCETCGGTGQVTRSGLYIVSCGDCDGTGIHTEAQVVVSTIDPYEVIEKLATKQVQREMALAEALGLDREAFLGEVDDEDIVEHIAKLTTERDSLRTALTEICHIEGLYRGNNEWDRAHNIGLQKATIIAQEALDKLNVADDNEPHSLNTADLRTKADYEVWAEALDLAPEEISELERRYDLALDMANAEGEPVLWQGDTLHSFWAASVAWLGGAQSTMNYLIHREPNHPFILTCTRCHDCAVQVRGTTYCKVCHREVFPSDYEDEQ